MTREYVCIHPVRSIAEFKKFSTQDPLECTFNHCHRSGYESDWTDLGPKCSYRRAKNGFVKTGANTVRHSKRIYEYDMTDSKLAYHNKRGRYSCASEGCDHVFKAGDRVVRLTSNDGARIYCVACAKERGIIE